MTFIIGHEPLWNLLPLNPTFIPSLAITTTKYVELADTLAGRAQQFVVPSPKKWNVYAAAKNPVTATTMTMITRTRCNTLVRDDLSRPELPATIPLLPTFESTANISCKET